MRYFLAVNGKQAGPFHENELALNGMTDDTLVWREGMEQWTEAKNVPELATYLQAGANTFNAFDNNETLYDQSNSPYNLQGNASGPFNPYESSGNQYGNQYANPYSTAGTNPYSASQPYGPTGYQAPNQLYPESYLIYNILISFASAICCCCSITAFISMILGIIGWYHGLAVNRASDRGDFATAQLKSRSAKKMAMWGGGLFIFGLLLTIVVSVFDPEVREIFTEAFNQGASK